MGGICCAAGGGGPEQDIAFNRAAFISAQRLNVTRDYKLERLLGKGAFGSVHLAKHRKKGFTAAVKIQNIDPAKHDQWVSVSEEYSLLKECDHPNIVQIFDVYFDESTFAIVQEYVPNSAELD